VTLLPWNLHPCHVLGQGSSHAQRLKYRHGKQAASLLLIVEHTLAYHSQRREYRVLWRIPKELARRLEESPKQTPGGKMVMRVLINVRITVCMILTGPLALFSIPGIIVVDIIWRHKPQGLGLSNLSNATFQ
jgi:hypothetical protein